MSHWPNPQGQTVPPRGSTDPTEVSGTVSIDGEVQLAEPVDVTGTVSVNQPVDVNITEPLEVTLNESITVVGPNGSPGVVTRGVLDFQLVSEPQVAQLLREVLVELKLMNFQLSLITDTEVADSDLGWLP